METSANTETKICVIDCDGNTTLITPPHPVWSDLTGGTVVQLNMVTLGGPDGLNS
jgi:hypothetical protein